MTASAFTPLPQDVADPDEVWRAVSQFIFAANGSTSWQRRWTLTGVTDAANYVMTIQNSGSGGLGLLVKASNGTTRLAVADAGVTIGGGIALSGNLTFVPDATYDIGAGSLRPRDVFLSRDLAVGRNETVAGTLGVTGTSTLGVLNAGATAVTTLHATGATVLDTTLGVTGTSTLGVLNAGATGVTALTATGNVALGDANADTITVIGATTFRNAAAAVQAFIDAANNRVIVGSATALSSASNDLFTVAGGTAYFAGPSGSAIGIRYNASQTAGWLIGVDGAGANKDLLFLDDGGAEIVRMGDTSSTYQMLVTGQGKYTSGVLVAVASFSTTEKFRVGGSSLFDGGLTVSAGGINITGSSVFANGVTITTGGLTVNGGTSSFAGDITLSSSPWTDFSSVITLTQSTTRTRTVTQAKYRVFGKTALVQFQVTCTDAGSAGSQIIIGGIPSAIAPANTGNRAVAGTFQVYDVSATTYYSGPAAFVSSTQLAAFQDGSTTGLAIGGTPSFALANGDIISCQLAYELA